MTDTIKTYLTKIKIGAEQSFKNLSIFPLLSDYFIPFDYLTIDDAISKDMVELMEIQQNGSAAKHKVINKSDQMILIYDDEKLAKGYAASQNGIVEAGPIVLAGAIRHQADDLLIVLPAGATASLWGPVTDIRIYCHDLAASAFVSAPPRPTCTRTSSLRSPPPPAAVRPARRPFPSAR